MTPPNTGRLALSPGSGPYQVQPWSTVERLKCIEALARQIHGYAQFVCEAEGSNYASVEVREKAITDFYKTLLTAEHELSRIHQQLKLA